MKFYLLVILCFSFNLFAQESVKDSNNFRRFWTEGSFDGQIMTQYMGTFNRDYLDFQTLAMGGFLRYKSKQTKGFQLVLGVNNVNRLGQDNLFRIDPVGKKSTRYEAVQFNNLNKNQYSIFIVGEAFLKIENKWLDLKIGRFDMETPMVHAQKGFFIPLYSQGVRSQFKLNKQWTLGAYYMNQQIPLGGGDFFNIASSVDVIGGGRNILGKPAQFMGNTKSSGMYAASVEWKNKKFHIRSYNYLFENLMNNWYTDLKYTIKWKGQWKSDVEAEYLNQSLHGNGGNEDLSKRYYDNVKPTHMFGGRLSIYNKNHKLSLAFNRITDDGKFIFNRGWGVEPFFTFQSRERMEGLSNHTAAMVAYELKKKQKWFNNKFLFSYGIKENGNVNDPSENRYQLPSFHHLVAIYTINFTKNNWEGLGMQVRVISKIPFDQKATDRQKMNNVNLIHTTARIFYNF